MNKLLIGFSKSVALPKGGFLFIDDEVPETRRHAKVFDPLRHSFNPLQDLDYRKAREIADIFYAASPQGESTLTVRNGKRALARLLLDAPKDLGSLPKPGKNDAGAIEATETVNDVLLSPVLRREDTPVKLVFSVRDIVAARNRRLNEAAARTPSTANGNLRVLKSAMDTSRRQHFPAQMDGLGFADMKVPAQPPALRRLGKRYALPLFLDPKRQKRCPNV